MLSRKISKEIVILSLIVVFGFLVRFYFWSNFEVLSLNSLSWDEASHVLGGVMINQTLANGFDLDFISDFKEHYLAVMGSLFFYPYGYTILSAFSFFFFGFSELAARLPSMIFSLLIIHAIYLLAQQMFNKKVGLLSALVAAINPWFIFWGGQALTDLPMVGLMIYSIYFCFKAIDDNKIKPWFLAGLFAGLAGLMKPPGFIVVPFLVLIVIYYKGFRFLLNKYFIILTLTVLFFFASYFGFALAAKFLLPQWGIISQKLGQAIYIDVFHWFNTALTLAEAEDPSWRTLAGWFYYPRLLLDQMGSFIILILVSLGALTLIINKNFKKLFSLLIYIVLIYLVFTILDNKNTRYTIPYLPFFCILAGLGLEKIISTYKKIIAWPLVAIVFILISLTAFKTVIKYEPTGPTNSYLKQAAEVITDSPPGLIVPLTEDDSVNAFTISFYVAINDPQLKYQVSWPVLFDKANYIISREKVNIENSEIIFDKDRLRVFKVFR